MKQIPCMCETVVEAEFPEEYDMGNDPSVEPSIFEGTFMSVKCPDCGKILKPEFPVRIFDKSRGIDLFMVPELERTAYLRNKITYPQANRVVIGYPELVEKLLLYKEQLDDRIVESIKYLLLTKAESEEDILIYFHARENADLIFHIHGLKADEVGVSKIPHSLYEKVLKEMDSKKNEYPFNKIITPPYVSVNKLLDEDI